MNLRTRIAGWVCSSFDHRGQIQVIEAYNVVKERRTMLDGSIYFPHLAVTTSCKWGCSRCGHVSVGDVKHLEPLQEKANYPA